MGDDEEPRPGAGVEWIDAHHLVVDGTRFTVATVPPGGAHQDLVIIKPPDLVRRYLDLLEAEQPEVIVELGVKEGGSTGLLALVAQPTAMLAIDLADDVPPLSLG